MPADQVEGLIQDYTFECDKLGDLMLDEIYERVRQLADEEGRWRIDHF